MKASHFEACCFEFVLQSLFSESIVCFRPWNFSESKSLLLPSVYKPSVTSAVPGA